MAVDTAAPLAPVPPTAVPAPARAALGERLAAAAVSLACLGVLIAGSQIIPSEAGHGSHTQLGLPPCGWALVTNAPCPTCGMTTAVAHATRGDFAQAFTTQPLGLLIALAAATAFWGGLHIALTGSRLGRLCGRFLQPRVLWGLAGVAAASWAYKWVTWTG